MTGRPETTALVDASAVRARALGFSRSSPKERGAGRLKSPRSLPCLRSRGTSGGTTAGRLGQPGTPTPAPPERVPLPGGAMRVPRSAGSR
jgi:hypothetical protein